MEDIILHRLFTEDPDLSDALYRFCRSYPGRGEAEAEFLRLAREAEEVMGLAWYLEFEERMNALTVLDDRACYLFGLGLREQLLRGLGAV